MSEERKLVVGGTYRVRDYFGNFSNAVITSLEEGVNGKFIVRWRGGGSDRGLCMLIDFLK